MLTISVRKLDGEILTVQADRKDKGELVLDKVCESIDLVEKDYFGLLYEDKTGQKNWVDLNKRLGNLLKSDHWEFQFAVKFYPPDPSQLQEDITRYQLCLQVRNDILSGKLPCSFVTHAMLGSYFVQSDLGDYSAEEYPDPSYLKGFRFAPDQTPELEAKVMELHKTHKGQTPAEAELHYLENAKKLAMYGVDIHPAKDSENVSITLGVCSTGILVHRDRLRMNRFAWPKIIKISYKRNFFYIKIRPGDFEPYENTIVFKLENYKAAKRLWQVCAEHHTFFRLMTPEDVPKPGIIPRLSNQFRYSRRTHYQTKQNAIEREPPSSFRKSQRYPTSKSLDPLVEQPTNRDKEANKRHTMPPETIINTEHSPAKKEKRIPGAVPVLPVGDQFQKQQDARKKKTSDPSKNRENGLSNESDEEKENRRSRGEENRSPISSLEKKSKKSPGLGFFKKMEGKKDKLEEMGVTKEYEYEEEDEDGSKKRKKSPLGFSYEKKSRQEDENGEPTSPVKKNKGLAFNYSPEKTPERKGVAALEEEKHKTGGGLSSLFKKRKSDKTESPKSKSGSMKDAELEEHRKDKAGKVDSLKRDSETDKDGIKDKEGEKSKKSKSNKESPTKDSSGDSAKSKKSGKDSKKEAIALESGLYSSKSKMDKSNKDSKEEKAKKDKESPKKDNKTSIELSLKKDKKSDKDSLKKDQTSDKDSLKKDQKSVRGSPEKNQKLDNEALERNQKSKKDSLERETDNLKKSLEKGSIPIIVDVTKIESSKLAEDKKLGTESATNVEGGVSGRDSLKRAIAAAETSGKDRENLLNEFIRRESEAAQPPPLDSKTTITTTLGSSDSSHKKGTPEHGQKESGKEPKTVKSLFSSGKSSKDTSPKKDSSDDQHKETSPKSTKGVGSLFKWGSKDKKKDGKTSPSPPSPPPPLQQEDTKEKDKDKEIGKTPKIVKTTTKQSVVKDGGNVTHNIEEKIEDLGTGDVTLNTTESLLEDSGASPYVTATAVTTRTATTTEDLEKNAKTSQVEEKTVARTTTHSGTRQEQRVVTQEVRATTVVSEPQDLRRSSLSSTSSDDSGTPIDGDVSTSAYYAVPPYQEPIVETEAVFLMGGKTEQPQATTTAPLVTTSTGLIGPAVLTDTMVSGEIVSSQTITSKTRTVETVTYKTEKDGVVETRVEQKITIQSDGDPIDHDKALAEAIQEATAMNPDMQVEKIEIQQESLPK